MTRPFTFTGENVRPEVDRFQAEAAPWKPPGFDVDADLRLDYYLDRQLADTVATLKKRFPQTHQDMVPVTLPLTRSFVNEQARVFLQDTVLELVDEKGEKLKPEDPLAAQWRRVTEDMGLAFRLKNVDRYTTLHRTCFLRIARVGKKLAAHIFFAHRVDVVWDPAFPFDLDMAYGVRLEVGAESQSAVLGPDGTPAASGARVFEFWCGRPDGAFFAVIDSNGTVRTAVGANPYGQLVPVVMWTAHTEELGPFVLANQGLHLFNRAVNVAATDEQHIAEAQGFGQLFLETQAGSGGVTANMVAGPARIVPLPEGAKVTCVNGNAPLGDLLSRLDATIKRAAVLHGIPPGAVSLEARAVASGVALQIEMRPLMEIRTDGIEVYRRPVVRLYDVIRAVSNATKQQGEKEYPPTTSMRWHPGDIQTPSDPQSDLDQVVVAISNRLMTRAEAIAKLRRIPLEEAKKLAKSIADELSADRGGAAAAGGAGQGTGEGNGSIAAGARERLGITPPGAQRRGAAGGANGAQG